MTKKTNDAVDEAVWQAMWHDRPKTVQLNIWQSVGLTLDDAVNEAMIWAVAVDDVWEAAHKATRIDPKCSGLRDFLLEVGSKPDGEV
jgi:hypothetical protein